MQVSKRYNIDDVGDRYISTGKPFLKTVQDKGVLRSFCKK